MLEKRFLDELERIFEEIPKNLRWLHQKVGRSSIPSALIGDATPSPEDLEVTKQLVNAGQVLDIEVLDHLIIGNPRYVSLKERMRW